VTILKVVHNATSHRQMQKVLNSIIFTSVEQL